MSDMRDAGAGGTSDEESTGGPSSAERMLAQLQSMIDAVATQAAPVVRQIGAKAAELAAVAADRAGPIAHRAADATADASVKLAERSRTWAAELRNKADDGNGSSDPSATAGTAVIEGPHDAAERSAQDDPAEGPRT